MSSTPVRITQVDANIQGKKKSTGGDGVAAEGNSKVGQKRKGAKKESAKEKQSKFLDAEAQQYEAEGVQPELIVGGKMRDYQLQGTAWLVSLFENGMNGILGDEMGLGKTVQTIAFFAHIFKQGVRVCASSVPVRFFTCLVVPGPVPCCWSSVCAPQLGKRGQILVSCNDSAALSRITSRARRDAEGLGFRQGLRPAVWFSCNCLFRRFMWSSPLLKSPCVM